MKPAMAPLPRPRIAPVAPEMIRYPYTEDRPATVGSGHLHWAIVAFSGLGEGDTLRDTTIIHVEAADEQGAIARAQEILVRAYYRVAEVREACSLDKEIRRGDDR